MPNLKKWEDIMKQKNKEKSFRDFLKEVCSSYSLNFYKRDWFITQFPDTDRIKSIISHEKFDENSDILCNYWLDYDFSNNFFVNFKKLFKTIDMFNLNNPFCENCNFASAYWSKDCYLTFIVINWCSNIWYSFQVKDNCRNVFNSVFVLDNSENIYFCNSIFQSYKIFYSKNIFSSNNIWFSSNLIWCQECILCDNIENKSYCIQNVEYSKEEYFLKKEILLKDKELYVKRFEAVKNSKVKNIWSNNSIWKYITKSENVEDSFYTYNLNNWKNVFFGGTKNWNENIYSSYLVGSPFWNNFYWSLWVGWWDNIFCSQLIMWANIYYCFKCESCSFCLWCVWLKNKSYCIFNKQYEKNRWYELADKIFAQMNDNGILWDSLPWYFNPFYFNDTLAGLIGDFTKEEVEKEWYLWNQEEIKVDIPENVDIIKIEELKEYEWYDDDWKWNINSEIMKKAIKDEKGNYYRIINTEYDFLIKNWLPIPREHWLERIKEGVNII